MACSLTTHKFDDVCAECVDLNNPPYVNTFSPHATFKHAILRKLAAITGLKTFVETGTNTGQTLDFVNPYFREFYSIELHEGLFENALGKFKNQNNVHLVFGDSALVLGAVLEKISESCLIWLDAHKTGGPSADAGDPIPSEMNAIYEKSPTSLVVLDDRWPKDFEAMNIPEGWHKRWYHGLMFVHRVGLYDIPERF